MSKICAWFQDVFKQEGTCNKQPSMKKRRFYQLSDTVDHFIELKEQFVSGYKKILSYNLSNRFYNKINVDRMKNIL